MIADDITGILVTYNSDDVAGNAITSLQTEGISTIIIVDNASKNPPQHPGITIFHNTTNEGFGRANNQALEQIQTPYALLLNPDAVLQPGSAQALLDAAKRYPDAAILAPMLCYENGVLQESYKRSVFARERTRDNFAIPDGDLCADFLSGAVWLVNMELLRKVGFFDPNIFLYYEDDDVCLRVKQAGYGLVLVKDALAVHLVGASSGSPDEKVIIFKQKHMIFSRLYLEQKCRGAEAAHTLMSRLKRHYRLKLLLSALTFKGKHAAKNRGRLEGVKAFVSLTAKG